MKRTEFSRVLVTAKCETCGKDFPMQRMGQRVCGWKCAAKIVKADTKARKDKLKTPSDRAKPAQASINRYVNARDRGKPCVSCGKPDIGVRNASHFKSRGSNSALRFHLWNLASSCYSCNLAKSGNIDGYRKGLEERHPGRVEWLDNHPRSREYSNEYYARITKIFNRKTKRLLARKENT